MKVIIQDKFFNYPDLTSHFVFTNPYSFLQMDFYFSPKFELFKSKVILSYTNQIYNFAESWIESSEILFSPYFFLSIIIIFYLLFISMLTKNLTYLPVILIISTLINNLYNIKSEVYLQVPIFFQELISAPFINKIFIIILLLIVTYIIALQNQTIRNKKEYLDVIYIVLFFILSLFIIFSAQNLVLIYLAIELQAFTIYTIAGIFRNSLFTTEATLKYFLLSSLSSIVFIAAASLFYYEFGTTNLLEIQNLLSFENQINPIVTLGSILLVLSLVAKIGLAPFHFWKFIDLYTGVPSLLAFFIIIFPKFSYFYLMFKFVNLWNPNINVLLVTIIIGTLIIGGLGALIQTNVRRFLAFSILFNNGKFLFAIILSNSFQSLSIFITFLIFYAITLLSLLMIINVVKEYQLNSLKELIALKSNPLLAFYLVINFLGLAGIPPFAIFFAKFFLLMEVFNKGFVLTICAAILINVVVSYYYLRIAKIVYKFSTSNPSNDMQVSYNEIKFDRLKEISLENAILLSFFVVVNLIFITFPKLIYFFTLTLFI